MLVTAYDIIYFWVARMIQMGLHFAGGPPFADVAIHGLIQAPDKRKMSKSLGNVIDPLDLVAEHGADPLRLALVLNAVPGHDTVPFQFDQVEAARRFGNKLWNAVRFALRYTAAEGVPPPGGYPEDPSPEERWILSRLHEVAARFDEFFDEYRLNDAYGLLYNFAWAEVCDWSLELAKAPLRRGDPGTVARTLGVVLRDLLALLHPIMPFLTEELWSHLVGEGFVATAAVAGAPRPTRHRRASPSSRSWWGRSAASGPSTAWRRVTLSRWWWPTRRGSPPPGGRGSWRAWPAVTPAWVARPPAGEGRTRLVVGPLEAFVSLAGAADTCGRAGAARPGRWPTPRPCWPPPRPSWATRSSWSGPRRRWWRRSGPAPPRAAARLAKLRAQLQRPGVAARTTPPPSPAWNGTSAAGSSRARSASPGCSP